MIVVISGPSGVGKGTVVDDLLRRNRDMHRSISATTRAPRPGEIDGTDYHFVTPQQFSVWVDNGLFAEYAVVRDNQYGTLKSSLDAVEPSEIVVLTIDIQGGLQIKRLFPDSLLIFLKPPDFRELERRLSGRGSEAACEIAGRLELGRHEMAFAKDYDYMVTNDRLDRAVGIVDAIIRRVLRGQE